ncbi:MAG: hypothetical protein ABW039_05900 [Sphingobium sp.]
MRLIPTFAAAMPCLVVLASCVGPARSAPQPGLQSVPPARPAPPASASGPYAPRPTPPQPQVPPAPSTTAWADRPLSAGSWTYRADAAAPAALYGAPGAAPRLIVRCDRAGRRILFVRAGGVAGAGQGPMTVRTSYGAQLWPASAAIGETVAARAVGDIGLDQIAYSRGKIAVEVPGLDPLVLPAWAEVARVIEDCRG